MTPAKTTLALLLASCAASAASAQQTLPGPAIIVTGQRPLFGVPAERSIGEEDISAYGISDVGELLNEVTSEDGETPDEPVILVNGKPATLDDISDYPAEVVSELQVLPRGSATRVGGSPNRRVYNIVLKKQASVTVGRAAVKVATKGHWAGRRGDVTYTNIKGNRRINGAIRLRNQDALLESQRGVLEPPGSLPDLGRYRTLQPRTRGYQLGLTASDQLAPWLNGTLTGKVDSSARRSLLGLAAPGEPFRQHGRSVSGSLDLSLNAEVGSWLVSSLSSYQYDRRRTSTDRILGADPLALGPSRTMARTVSASSDLTASGPLFELPAGPLRLTLGAGVSRDSVSGSHRFGAERTSDTYVQHTTSENAGVDVPLASKHFLPALGELTASIQLSHSHVSNFGSLTNQTYALTWQPSAALRLFGSVTTGKTPPVIGRLVDPILETPGVAYYDPLRGETVEVTEISGGNPELAAPSSTNRRLTANLKPFKSIPLQLTAEYSAVRNRDIIVGLPEASELIMLAFPERFIRDPSGVLTTVDIRPVQFAREDRDQFRYGINLNLPLGHHQAATGAGAGAAAADAADDKDEDAAAPARTRKAVAAAAHPRLQFNLSHVLLLKSELEIRPGIEPVDLLSRGGIGLGGASRPRHQVDFSLGYAERGLGVRLTGQYRSANYLRLSSNAATSTLTFSPLTTFSVRAFAEPTRFAPHAQWLNGSRLTLSVLNITDQRQRVRTDSGVTPLAYQPAYRDPIGRTVELELRKSF